MYGITHTFKMSVGHTVLVQYQFSDYRCWTVFLGLSFPCKYRAIYFQYCGTCGEVWRTPIIFRFWQAMMMAWWCAIIDHVLYGFSHTQYHIFLTATFLINTNGNSAQKYCALTTLTLAIIQHYKTMAENQSCVSLKLSYNLRPKNSHAKMATGKIALVDSVSGSRLVMTCDFDYASTRLAENHQAENVLIPSSGSLCLY